MMNIFRLSADLTHLASIFILLAKIRQSRSCVGKKKLIISREILKLKMLHICL